MRLSIIIPTYKEAENLKILIPQLIKRFSPYEIIIVDDNSQDGTDDISPYLGTSILKTLTRKEERGIGSAIARGYDEAIGDVLLSIDADLSMDLEDVPRMLSMLDENDVIVGSRYIPGGQNRKEAFLPRLASVVGNWMFKAVFRLPIKDVSMNFRVLKKATWKQIRTTENTNVMLLEMLVNAHDKGFRIAEVPTVFKERVHGETKTRVFRLTLKYIKFIAKYLYTRKFGFNTGGTV